jgi:hypothetical protein
MGIIPLCKRDKSFRHTPQFHGLRIRSLDAFMVKKRNRQIPEKRLPVARSHIQFCPSIQMPHGYTTL